MSKKQLRALVIDAMRAGKNSIALSGERVSITITTDSAKGALTGIITYPNRQNLAQSRLEVKTGAGIRYVPLSQIKMGSIKKCTCSRGCATYGGPETLEATSQFVNQFQSPTAMA